MNQICCGGVNLNCENLVALLQRGKGKFTRKELLDSKEMRDIVRQYSEAIRHQGDVSWIAYEWFADAVVGALLLTGASISVAFDPTEIKWSISK